MLTPIVKNLSTHAHQIKLLSRNAPEKLIHYISILHFELDIINCLVERSPENKALISKKKENLLGDLINLMAIMNDGHSQYLIAEIVYRSTMVGLPSKTLKLSTSKSIFKDKVVASSFSTISNSKFNESMRHFLNTYNNSLHPSIRKIVSFKLDSLSIGKYKFEDRNSSFESSSPTKKIYKNNNLWLDVGFKNFCFWARLENDEQFTFVPFASVEGIQRRKKDIGNMKYQEVLIIIRIPLALIPSIFVESQPDRKGRIRLFLRMYRRDVTKFERYVVSPILTNPDMSNISLGQFSDASLKEPITIKDDIKENKNLKPIEEKSIQIEPKINSSKFSKQSIDDTSGSTKSKSINEDTKKKNITTSKGDSEIEKPIASNKSQKRSIFSKQYQRLKNKLKKSNKREKALSKDNDIIQPQENIYNDNLDRCNASFKEVNAEYTYNEDLEIKDEEYFDEGMTRCSKTEDIKQTNLEMSSVAVLYSPSPFSQTKNRKRTYSDTNLDEELNSFSPSVLTTFKNPLDSSEEIERVSFAFMDICRDENYNISPLKKSKYSPLELTNAIQTPHSPFQKNEPSRILDKEKMESPIKPRKLFQEEMNSQSKKIIPINETIRAFGKDVKEDIKLRNAQLESIMRNSLIQISQAGNVIQEQIQKVLSIQKECESISKEYGNYVYQIFDEFETNVINEVEII